MELTQLEARVIGCLLEKEVTTPEQYPLSLNALTSACNQKTSREPVMSLTETQVQETIDALNKKRLLSEQSGFGSRVVKYKHRFCNTEFSDLQFSTAELSVICLLLLRGPQTPGELRTRSNRLHPFSDINDVELTLSDLANRNKALVRQLPREVGRREIRFTHLFSPSLGDEFSDATLSQVPTQAIEPSASSNLSQPSLSQPQASSPELEHRVTELEQQVAALIEELTKLKASLGE